MVWLALFGIDRDFNPVARRDVRGGRMDFLRLLDLGCVRKPHLTTLAVAPI
jgi:hypothetical protein